MERLNPLDESAADRAEGASEAKRTAGRGYQGVGVGLGGERQDAFRQSLLDGDRCLLFSEDLKERFRALSKMVAQEISPDLQKSHFWEGMNASRYNDIIQIVSSALYLSGIQTEH